MDKNNHISTDDLAERHQPKKGEKEKGCLIRCRGRTENHVCSHQWQAQVKAEEIDYDVYNYPKYWSLCGEGKFRTGARGWPHNYGKEWLGFYWKDKPTHEGKEWDVKKNDNFTHFLKPYWHNAHHIIPNGALKAAINKTSKVDIRLPNLIRYCLLKAEYNLNDMVNMIILPQGKNVAIALGLPRHLKGDSGALEPAPGVGLTPDSRKVDPSKAEEKFSHKNYSNTIEDKLIGIIDQYKKALENAIKEHPKLECDLDKKKLENLSEKIHKEIVDTGPVFAGNALSHLFG
ncbi:MAG: AHH domain-containing protein [Deltaproteobacteria bacterium]|nr:AHH domain-containing protein [Deltaproteobacteria bacterium]